MTISKEILDELLKGVEQVRPILVVSVRADIQVTLNLGYSLQRRVTSALPSLRFRSISNNPAGIWSKQPRLVAKRLDSDKDIYRLAPLDQRKA